MAEFVGSYELYNNGGNFDDFLRELGVGFFNRKILCGLTPTVTISTKDDGTIVIETESSFKTSTIEFKLGEEFDQERMDDKTVKTVITQDGNKLIEKQGKEVEIVREFFKDRMVATCKCNNVVCVREYRKV